jgi:para-aminobenzoate synthetase component I
MNREYHRFSFSPTEENISKFLSWATDYSDHVAFLNSNNGANDSFSAFESLLAVGAINQICPGLHSDAFQELKDFSDKHKDWLFGFLSYDLKNQLENLSSIHDDGVGMPLMHFFLPEIVFIFQEDEVIAGIIGEQDQCYDKIKRIFREVSQIKSTSESNPVENIRHKVTRSDYIESVFHIQDHIRRGDIYEMNYCIEFYSNNAFINPVGTYIRLNEMSPTPFSCFYRYNDKYLLSSTPERFLAKRGNHLISQPIKGTIRRGKNTAEDEKLKSVLFLDPKERSENVMIVDLVRNDLAQTAVPGSVKVQELFGIYTYPSVHQMISTITSELSNDFHYVDAIRKAFPMGSMTGAPKIKALELIEKYEKTRRGLYSGAVGYISPDKEFDFNVIIRSILYNKDDNYLSFMAGSAITIDSVPDREYSECLLKAGAMAQTLGISRL